MRKRLQITLIGSLTAISLFSTLFSTVPARAQSGVRSGAGARADSITSTTDESGRKIYINGDGPSPSTASRTEAWEVTTYLDGKAQSHQTLNRAFTAQDIDAAIDQAAARHNVDPSLVRSVVKVESNFNPNAVSRKGAMGLMQLMPSTARSLNVSNPFDPQQNVDAGVRHLRRLLDSYGGDVSLSLAAYNAGSGAVARSAGVPHFRETQNYVRRITNLYNGGSEPGSYIFGNPVHEPVHVQRDARGVLHISNTE